MDKNTSAAAPAQTPVPAPSPSPATQSAPAVTPAPSPTPPAPPAPEFKLPEDPEMRGLLEGLGLAIGEKPKAQPAVEPIPNSVGRTLADTLKFADERRAMEGKKADPDPAAPATPAAEAPKSDPNQPAAPTPAPAPTPAAAAPAPTPTPAATPKVEVEKRKPIDQVVEEAVRKVIGDKPATPPAPEPAPANPPAQDPFEATLNDDERDALAFARYAAQKNPEKYGNLPAQQLAFFKKVDSYVQTARAENAERTFDESDTDFIRFVQANKPRVDQRDRKQLERQQIIEEAQRLAEENLRKETEEIRRKQHVLEMTPKVEHAVQTFATESENALAQDTNSPAAAIVQKAKQEGWDKVLQEDQVFAPIVRHYHRNAVRLASTYESIYAGLVDKLDPNNADHVWLHKFVTSQADHFKQNGGDARVRDGKTFITPKEFAAMQSSRSPQVANHWTFDDRDVLGLLADNARWNINEALKREEQRLSASGFQRATKAQLPKAENPPAPAPSPPPSPEPAASPRAVASAAPGAAKSGGATPPTGVFSAREWSALGLPAVK